MSSDPHQGGDLSDMAVKGTSIPGDAGKQNLIPSKPRPDQISDPNDLGATNLAEAADNQTDIPRTTLDQGAGAEIISASGHSLPAEAQSKRLHNVPGGVVTDPAAKGHGRDEQRSKQKGSDLDHGASDGPDVEAPPGMEGSTQEEVRNNIDRKA